MPYNSRTITIHILGRISMENEIYFLFTKWMQIIVNDIFTLEVLKTK